MVSCKITESISDWIVCFRSSTRGYLQSTLVFRIALKADRIFFAARFFLEAVGAKWGRQQRERPLESKLRRLGGKNKPVKENAAASNEPINSRERMIMAISEIGHASLSPLIIIVIF